VNRRRVVGHGGAPGHADPDGRELLPQGPGIGVDGEPEEQFGADRDDLEIHGPYRRGVVKMSRYRYR